MLNKTLLSRTNTTPSRLPRWKPWTRWHKPPTCSTPAAPTGTAPDQLHRLLLFVSSVFPSHFTTSWGHVAAAACSGPWTGSPTSCGPLSPHLPLIVRWSTIFPPLVYHLNWHFDLAAIARWVCEHETRNCSQLPKPDWLLVMVSMRITLTGWF